MIFIQFYMIVSIFQSLVRYTESLDKMEERLHLIADEEKGSSKKKKSEKEKDEVALLVLQKEEPEKVKKGFWSKKSKKEKEVSLIDQAAPLYTKYMPEEVQAKVELAAKQVDV